MGGHESLAKGGGHRTSGLALFSAIDKVAPKPGISNLTGGGPTAVSL